MVPKLTEKSTVFQPEKILDISLSNCDIACTFTSSLSIPMTTISEIAHRARVSIGTVDRVIHNRGRVAKKTEEKIKKIIKELDFKPNIYARNLKLKKTFTFGVLLPFLYQDSKYWELPVLGINKAQYELAGHKVIVKFFHYDKYSESSLKKACKEVLQTTLHGLLIAPVLLHYFESFVKDIPDTIPYIFIDSTVPSAHHLSFIGQDSFQSGYLSARLMHLLLGDEGHVAVIKLLPHDYHIDTRATGFLDYLHKNTQIKSSIYEIAESENGNFAKNIFKKKNDLNGLFVTYASTHPFAAYIDTYPSQKDVKIIGYDLIAENIKYLKKGTIDFLINQMPQSQGYEGIYCLYKHVILDEPVEKKIEMRIDIVTKENVDYYQ